MRALILCLLLLSVPAAALQEEVFRDWVEESDSLKIGNIKLTASYVKDSVLMQYEGSSLSVPLGQCRYMKPFEVCFNDTRLVLDGIVLPEEIHDTGVETEMFLVVYAELAQLKLTRAFGTTSLLINQETTVKAVIENTGLIDALQVEYTEKYPKSVEVKSAMGCTLADNRLTWTGSIRWGQKVTCEYVLRGLDDKSFAALADLKYYNGVEKARDAYSTEFIVLRPALHADLGLDKSRVILGEELSLLLNLTNTHNMSLNVRQVKLSVPSALKVLDSGGLSGANEWKGTIVNGTTLLFPLRLRAEQTGEHVISLYAAYAAGSVFQNQTVKKSLKVSSDLQMSWLEELPERMTAGQPAHFFISIVNPSSEKALLDLKATVQSDIPGFVPITVNVDSVGRNNRLNLIESDITAPEPGEYTINATVRYRSEFREEFEESLVRRMTVRSPAAMGEAPAEPVKEHYEAPLAEERKFTLPKMPKWSALIKDSKRTGGILILTTVAAGALLLIYIKRRVRS